MELEERLEKLRGGVTLVKPEDRKAVEQMYSEKIGQWRKRKRMFKDLWDAITENSPKDLKEFKVSSCGCKGIVRNCHLNRGAINTFFIDFTGRSWN